MVMACGAWYVMRFNLFVQLLAVYLITCGTTTADTTAFCHELEPFLVQTLPQASAHLLETAIAKEAAGDNVNVTCALTPGKSVVVLLGSSNVHRFSPLRNPPPVIKLDTADGEFTHEVRGTFMFRYFRSWVNGFRAYSWTDPASVERFFFKRHIFLRFRVSDSTGNPNADIHLSASEVLTMAGLHSIRVTSFAPVAVEIRLRGGKEPKECSDATCSKYVDTFAEHSDKSAGLTRLEVLPQRFTCSPGYGTNGWGSGVSGGPMDGEVYAFEEIGPYRGSNLWIPQWLSAWLGRRPMMTVSEKVVLDGMGRRKFLFHAEIPAVKPVCLRLSAVKNDNLIVELEESTVFDTFWLKIMLLFVLLVFIKPWVEEIPALQIFIAGLGSVTLLFVVTILYVLKRLQGMTIGKVGLVAMATLGGTALLAETFLSAVVALYYAFVHYDNEAEMIFYGSAMLLVFGLTCGLLSRHYCATYLTELTRWTLRLLQLAVLACAIMQNREATFASFVAALLFHPPRILRLIQWFSSSSSLVNNENEPQETFPSEALREVTYVTPLCMEGRTGRVSTMDSRERLDLYRISGNEYTHRALEDLARRVNSNPDRYASKVNDAGGVLNWAKGYQYS
ncbi:hypothetical protein, conserved [Trypanosoma brucei gambiense DAL972]|uniref:Transmembrane protein n=1 Tax=Trypanosoma brucei gambiense (strain MHOM/CI/86/DAL972) TaxID=679716 RepID=D0A253_TRYB9|nr:hypothetical protein, conserved [Trypanosoma brucei gambiense DAL972]CBH15347.1 hypothetical protein, conserved [Trypanosoma brucei gambiense DAL972]|eukprot:XP_011777611.1 hypothetical protein, conserved [Trypanosoma brucei gambiense DAL972]